MEKTINLTITRELPVSPPTKILRRVRKWGDPIMVPYGFDVHVAGTSNFQAVRCWNQFTGFGAVSNFLYIPHAEVMLLRDMQFDERVDGVLRTTTNKMNWLCSYRGSIYMYDNENDDWTTAPRIRWGTLTLGGNIVQVEQYEMVRTVFDGSLRDVEMARLVGFKPSDWSRDVDELLTEGLVHRCYCAYFPDNNFGDSPKGIVYSPFFSPAHYDFVGAHEPKALYIPVKWLE